MMTYYAIDHKGLECEFNMRLSERDQERLTRRMQANRPSILMNIRQGIAKKLITAGRKLEGNRHTEVISQY